jgi:hypothetical protein
LKPDSGYATLLGNGRAADANIERGANQRIWIPIVLWLLFYGFMLLAYLSSFPGVLLLLIFPVLGFFGIFDVERAILTGEIIER